jgi:hypothetical protein
LKDEPDVAADAKRVASRSRIWSTRDPLIDRAARRAVDAAEQIEHGRLAAS